MTFIISHKRSLVLVFLYVLIRIRVGLYIFTRTWLVQVYKIYDILYIVLLRIHIYLS